MFLSITSSKVVETSERSRVILRLWKPLMKPLDQTLTVLKILIISSLFYIGCPGRGANLGSFLFSFIFSKLQRLRPLGYCAPPAYQAWFLSTRFQWESASTKAVCRVMLEVDQPMGSSYLLDGVRTDGSTYLWADKSCVVHCTVCMSVSSCHRKANELCLPSLLASTVGVSDFLSKPTVEIWPRSHCLTNLCLYRLFYSMLHRCTPKHPFAPISNENYGHCTFLKTCLRLRI